MKGCVFVAVLWFAFCAMQANTTITTTTATTTSTLRSTQASISTTVSNPTLTATATSTRTTATTTSISSSSQPSVSTTVSSPTSSATATSTRTTATTTSISSSSQPSVSTTVSSPTSSATATSTRTTATTTSISSSSQPSVSTTVSSPTSSATATSTRTTATTTSISSSSQPSVSTTVSSPTSSATATSTRTTATTTSISSSSQPSISTTVSSPTSSGNGSTNGSSPHTPTPAKPTTPSGNGSTNGSSPHTPTPAKPTTPSAPLPCEKNPCIGSVECINLVEQQYVCQCSFGSYYTTILGCQQGKIFPGDLSLTNLPYNPLLEYKNTTEYKQLYDNVTQFFQSAFQNESAYKETIILSVRPSPSALERLRKGERTSSTVVSLINMFDMSTTLNSTQVEGLVQRALSESPLSGASFTPTPQCDTGKICDSQTTICTEKGDNTIATCECKAGLAKKIPQDTSCLLCAADCSQANNKQCIMKEGVPNCQCMTNFYAKDGGCQECAFGYSGENCEDNHVAVIVGVSVACGIVIVVLAGVLIYKSLRAKKKLNPERRSLLSKDYSAAESDSESKSAISVAPREKTFPRVQMKNQAGQGGQARNTGEGGLGNSAYLPEQDYDDADPSAFEMTARSKF